MHPYTVVSMTTLSQWTSDTLLEGGREGGERDREREEGREGERDREREEGREGERDKERGVVT